METEKAVVVPLHEVADVPDTEMMLRMILNHEALLVKRSNAPMEKSSSWISAQASGHFAKALSQVTQEMGSIPGNDLYHVILPPGTTTKDLVAAVGGGFRGLTRQAGSTKISGQVRLIPATGASIAAGPMIATVALAMAGDMLAQHQMNAKLDAIHHEVAAMRNRFSDDDKAVLVAAEKQSRLVAGYLLDEARIPAISTASQAFGDLEKLTYRYVEQLDRWSDTVKRYGKKTHVNGSELLQELTGSGKESMEDFEAKTAQLYQALALRSRAVVLENIAAGQDNQNRSLAHVEMILHKELDSIASRQRQLLDLLDDMCTLPIVSAKIPIEITGRRTRDMRTRLFRLSRAFHTEPEALPVLDDMNHTMLDLATTAQGLSVIEP